MVQVSRNIFQQFFEFFDPNTPYQIQELSVLVAMYQQLASLNSLFGNQSGGLTISTISVSTSITVNINSSTVVHIQYPSYLAPTKNSTNLYERSAENVQGVISGVVTSTLVTQISVPSGYVGFIKLMATDDNVSSFHQFIIDGQPDTQYSGTASPQANAPFLELPLPIRFNKSFQYWATNYNASVLTYQGIFVGWFTPANEV